jgi:hypothetical protein
MAQIWGAGLSGKSWGFKKFSQLKGGEMGKRMDS